MACLVGCGIDIEERNRFTKHANQHKLSSLIQRIFTPAEILLNTDGTELRFALGFSCKESVFKALGVSWTNSPIQWTDIELLMPNKNNIYQHEIKLHNFAAQLYQSLGGKQVISNFEYNHQFVFFQIQITH